MDIRLVKESKPNLGEAAEARFRIIHNRRIIGLHEPPTASFLAANGPQKMSTKKHLFLLSTRDGRSVEVTMTEPRPDGQPFMSFPETVRLFCNEIDILHSNRQVFTEKTEDEVMQIITELLELAPHGELFVEQGKNSICIRLQEGKIHFRTPELSEPARNGSAALNNGKAETHHQPSHA